MAVGLKHASSNGLASLAPRIGTAITTCLLTISGIATLFLGVLSIFSTTEFKIDGPSSGVSPDFLSITEEIIFHYGLPSIQFVAGFILLAAGTMVIGSALRRIPLRRISQALVLITLIVSLLWVLSLNAKGAFWYNDSRSLIDSSRAFLEGDYAQFDPSASDHGDGSPEFYSYYSWYPFQTGAMLWFSLVFFFIGAGNIAGYQVINAFLTAGIVWAVWQLSKRCGFNETTLRHEALLLILCVPLYTSAAFVYPNTAGLFLVLLAVLVAVISMQTDSYPHMCLLAVAAYLIAAVAMLVKGTVIIFVIALTICLIVTALVNRRYWLALLCCVMFIVSHQLSSLSVVIVETVTGEQFGEGLPQLSWIAMGLDPHSTSDNPGWWNDSAINAYALTSGDPAGQSQIAKQSILDSLTAFVQDPAMAWEFLRDKLASEWAEPSFQAFHYTHLTETNDPGFLTSEFLGPRYSAVLSFENVYQSIIYLFAVIGIFRSIAIRKAIPIGHLLCISCVSLCFLGGFGCFLLWEAKSVYTLPYVIMLIPLAASGLSGTSHALARVFRWMMQQRSSVAEKSTR